MGRRMVPVPDHLKLEIAFVRDRGRPLQQGEPVPGCPCPTCTGIPAAHPARRPHYARAPGSRGSLESRRRERDQAIDVARAFSILTLVQALGCGPPVRRGRELAVRCPLHRDRNPSLRISERKQVWFCDACGIGGDGIALWMRARRVSFMEAVSQILCALRGPSGGLDSR